MKKLMIIILTAFLCLELLYCCVFLINNWTVQTLILATFGIIVFVIALYKTINGVWDQIEYFIAEHKLRNIK